MKLDQIAFYARDLAQAARIKEQLGLASSDWVEDFVEGQVSVYTGIPHTKPEVGHSRAHLQFNYAFGTEVEILTYLDGPHWHEGFAAQRPATKSWLSHIGFHLADGEDFPDVQWPLVQELVTEVHTNEYVLSRGRTFHYRIYDARKAFGCYIKYIKRIHSAHDDRETPNPAGV